MLSKMSTADSAFILTPAVPKLSKKPGPTCRPIMNTKSTSPNSCRKVMMGMGAVKPMWPATMPANNTNVTPSEIPPNLIFPKRTPMDITNE